MELERLIMKPKVDTVWAHYNALRYILRTEVSSRIMNAITETFELLAQSLNLEREDMNTYPNVPQNWTYAAKVNRVIDGDTIDVDIEWDIGFGVRCKTTQRLRLARINAPELRRGAEEEKQAGRDATKFLKALLLDEDVIIKTSKADSFGRYIAEVSIFVWKDPSHSVHSQRVLGMLDMADASKDYREAYAIAFKTSVTEGTHIDVNEMMVAAGHAVFQDY